jgi:integrase
MAAPALRPTFANRRGITRDMSKLGSVLERETPGGKARWYIAIAGYKVYRGRDAMGEWDFTSREDAERYLARIRSRVEDGRDLQAVLDQILPKARRTILELSKRWLDHKEAQAQAGEITWRAYRVFASTVKVRWEWWKDTPAEGLSKGAIVDWATHLGRSGLAPASVQYSLATLKSFYGWLLDREEISRAPRFPSVTIPEHTPKVLTRTQQDAILGAIPEAERGIFLALADCGLRPGEARALRVGDVRDDGWLMVRRAAKDRGHTAPIGPTKTKRNRDVPPYTDRLHAWLAQHPPAGLLLFESPASAGRGWMWSHKELLRAWKKGCESAGIPHVGLYEGTKHTFGTHLREQGANLETIALYFGHGQGSQHTQRYARSRPAELVRLREKK